MTWTYSGDPSSSNKDAVRFLIGDTEPLDPILQDEEILWLLSEYGSPIKASYHAALTAAGKYARLVTQEAGRIKVKAEGKYLQYKDLADQLRADIKSGLSVKSLSVFAGGISVSDVDKRNNDPDRVQPPFKIGEDNYNGC